MTLVLSLKIALVALSLALDVFAVSIGVGMRPISRALKVRVGAAFACAEVAMTLIGVGLGFAAERLLGQAVGYLGFAALFGVGLYMIYESLRAAGPGIDLSRGWGLLLAALSVSIDSLGVGFSILYIGVPLAASLAAIAGTSVLATSSGLTLGAALGRAVEKRAGLWAGTVLAATGLFFAALKAFGR